MGKQPHVTTRSPGPLSATDRTRIRRLPDRAQRERAALYEVLDGALICHLGVIVDGSPVVIPTGYGRDGDTLYLHGSTGASSLRAAASGAQVCVTVTRLDGIVLARSVFHHSMNYRSAVIYGVARTVTDGAEKLAGLRALAEHLAPGRWAAVRAPSRKELAATKLLALPLTEASVKMRQGPPSDDEADLAGDVWAGVLPVRQVFDPPVPDPATAPGTSIPAHVRDRVTLS
jgi:nitroimidazol reductase NimA-like FMN-containing flavoprotein (pyridoxamine 5'-phosphate oxidase superfamily)